MRRRSVYGEPATPFVATFVGTANLVHGEAAEGIATTRFGPVRLVGQGSAAHRGRGLVVLRPEHLDVHEAPDGPADGSAWRVLRRRFTGTEILYEVAAGDGERLWVEAGHAVRRLRLGDAVQLRLRDHRDGLLRGRDRRPRPPSQANEPSASRSSPRRPMVSRSNGSRKTTMTSPTPMSW